MSAQRDPAHRPGLKCEDLSNAGRPSAAACLVRTERNASRGRASGEIARQTAGGAGRVALKPRPRARYDAAAREGATAAEQPRW
jgi:hypothetical protein